MRDKHFFSIVLLWLVLLPAAAGLIWGVASPRSASDPTPRVLVGLAGAGLGALAGCVICVPAAFLIPGRLVYRHSPAYGKTISSAARAEQAPNQSGAVGSIP